MRYVGRNLDHWLSTMSWPQTPFKGLSKVMGCRTVNILDLCHIVKRFALTDNVARKLI